MECSIFALALLSFTMVAQVTGVAALTNNSDIIGMAVAGCAGFVLLSIVVGIIVVSFQWTDWFNNWMRLRGKVRLPRSYFRRKKKEARRRLISGSVASRPSQSNGMPPVFSSIDTASWVQGTRKVTRQPTPRLYEEKDAMVELGEEDDVKDDDDGDEYVIETELVEDEVLNVGLLGHYSAEELHAKNDAPRQSNMHSTGGSMGGQPQVAMSGNSEGTAGSSAFTAAGTSASTEHKRQDGNEHSDAQTRESTNFDGSYVYF